jgi:tetratricopeptide (TPR) repeat protein
MHMTPNSSQQNQSEDQSGSRWGFRIFAILLLLDSLGASTGRPAYESLYNISLAVLIFGGAALFYARKQRLTAESGPAPPPSFKLQSLGPIGLASFGSFLLLRILQGHIDSGAIDSFESGQATLLASISLVALVLGTRIRGNAHKDLAGGLILLSLLLSPLFLLDSNGAGLTGNTGYNSQVVLPGACISIFLLIHGRLPYSVLCWLAALGTSFFVATTPVVGAAAVLGAWMILASLAPSEPDNRKVARGLARLGAGLLLLVLSFSMGGSKINPVDAPPDGALEAQATPEVEENNASDLAGANVRTLIWSTMPALIQDYPLGVGTGQFQSIYPRYRDQREIELTSHGRRVAELLEVEHPHNDLLFAFAEQGILGGLLFGSGWLCAGLALLASVFRKGLDSTRRALSFGALATLAICLFHAPLLSNYIAGPLAFLTLGATLSTASRAPESANLSPKAPAIPLLILSAALLALLLQVPTASAIKKHELGVWNSTNGEPRNPEQALAACPDSFEANAAMARFQEWQASSGGSAIELSDPAIFWRAALAVRPHSIEALTNLGGLLAARGDFSSALELWSHARELDVGYPVIRRNLRRLGADLVLTGQLAQGLPELAPDLANKIALAPKDLPIDLGSYLFDAAASEPDALRKRALTCAAQWTWARESAADGKWPEAIRLYRQASRDAAREPARTNPPLDFEYAAALAQDGRHDEAEALWSVMEVPPTAFQESPAWASEIYEKR